MTRVSTQAELNAAVARGDWRIEVDSPAGVVLRVSGGSTVVASGDSTVHAYGDSTVRAYNNSNVRAYGDSTVVACDSSNVAAYGSSNVAAYDSSTVHAYGDSTVRAYNNSNVHAYGDSTAVHDHRAPTPAAKEAPAANILNEHQLTKIGSQVATIWRCQCGSTDVPHAAHQASILNDAGLLR